MANGCGAQRAAQLIVGKIYRLRFPGIAARVIKPPANVKARQYPYLVQSIILGSRWWVNERGEPDNIHSPHLIPTFDEGAETVSVAPAAEGQVSGGK